MHFRGRISGSVERGVKTLSGGTVKEDWDLKTHNELSVTQESLFPSVKTTSFRLRMFCPVFRKEILEESFGRGGLI